MTEPTVQVPVSLIERMKEALLKLPPSSYNADIYGDLHRLSQPTPTAEHEPDCDRASELSIYCDCRAGQVVPSEPKPPRIAEMAPGTTFRCGLYSFTVVDNFTRREDGLWYHRDEFIDPSTIRDVQPPKDAA